MHQWYTLYINDILMIYPMHQWYSPCINDIPHTSMIYPMHQWYTACINYIPRFTSMPTAITYKLRASCIYIPQTIFISTQHKSPHQQKVAFCYEIIFCCWIYSVLLSFFMGHTTPLPVLRLNSILLVCHLWRNSEQSRSVGHPLNASCQRSIWHIKCIFLLHLFRENTLSCCLWKNTFKCVFRL